MASIIFVLNLVESISDSIRVNVSNAIQTGDRMSNKFEQINM